MPPIGYGLGTAWFRSQGDEAIATLKQSLTSALDGGFRHVDEAELYENEAHSGPALQEWLSRTGTKREEVFVTGKVMSVDEGIDVVCSRSLERMGLEYFDLYLVHAPFMPDGSDFRKTLPEVWAEMEGLVASGKVRRIGVSNWRVEDLEQIYDGAKIKPVCNQVEAHPYLQQTALLDYCERHEIMVTAYAPLASLTKPELQGGPVDAVVDEIAARLGATPAQVLMRWSLQRSSWTGVITTTSKAERLQEFLAVKDLELTADDVAAISAAGQQKPQRIFWADSGRFAADPSNEADSRTSQTA